MTRIFHSLFCFFAATVVVSNAEPVSFYREVMPILSKSGCSAGACHGNANGKGGFKLSLRGEAPERDAATLLKEIRGKRLNVDNPAASYLLRKPTTQVSHDGGKKFDVGSPEYETLRRWIAEGAKNDLATAPKLQALEVTPTEAWLEEPNWTVKISATAVFEDGSRRDVSAQAVYETSNLLCTTSPDGTVTATREGETTVSVRFLHLQIPVRLAFVASRPNFTWSGPEPFNELDAAVFAKLQRMKINPSDLCSDAVFLRRLHLDLLGVPPTADEARKFLADSTPTREKRAAAVDALLQRPEFGERWAVVWSDLLRNEEKMMDWRGVRLFFNWMRDGFNADQPLTDFARALLSGTGSTYENPAASYYRVLRDPATRAETTAQVFLGVRLQCAKCHNHPFEKWTQDDYYRFAGLFDGIDYHILNTKRRDNLDKHEMQGEQVVFLHEKREFKDPRSDTAPQMGFLDPAVPLRDHGARLDELAQWIAGGNNAAFAEVQVNRVWFHLMGRGMVDPVDDFRATNPASNPALLRELAEGFARDGFRLKPLIRRIVLSRTYQTSSAPNDTNANDESNFSRAIVRRWPAEPLLDSIYLALGVKPEFRSLPQGTRAGQICGVKAYARGEEPTDDDYFLRTFGKPQRLLPSETERTNQTSLAQAFTLTSGQGLNRALTEKDNRLAALEQLATQDPGRAVDELFWTLLSRPPSEAEQSLFRESLENTANKRTALEDLTWALINSKEFLLRH